ENATGQHAGHAQSQPEDEHQDEVELEAQTHRAFLRARRNGNAPRAGEPRVRGALSPCRHSCGSVRAGHGSPGTEALGERIRRSTRTGARFGEGPSRVPRATTTAVPPTDTERTSSGVPSKCRSPAPGRPIQWPCSATKSCSRTSRWWKRYAPIPPVAEPVTGSSVWSGGTPKCRAKVRPRGVTPSTTKRCTLKNFSRARSAT